MDKLTAEKYAISVAKVFGKVKIDTPTSNEQRLYKVQVGPLGLEKMQKSF